MKVLRMLGPLPPLIFESNAGEEMTYQYWKGMEQSVWSEPLSAGEVQALYKGFSPLLIRPNALLRWASLLGVYQPGDENEPIKVYVGGVLVPEVM